MSISRGVVLVGFLLALTGCRACATKMFGPKVSKTTVAGHQSWEARIGAGADTVPSATVVDGVAIVELASLQDAGLLVNTVAAAFGLRDHGLWPRGRPGSIGRVAHETQSCRIQAQAGHRRP